MWRGRDNMKILFAIACSLAIFSTSSAMAVDPFHIDVKALAAQIKVRDDAVARYTAMPRVGQTQLGNGTIAPSYSVGIPDIISWSGQGVRSFLEERGDILRKVTRETGWEVCARICLSRDGRYGLRITTHRAALFCGVAADQCPAGMVGLNANVHTHGAGSIVQLTQADHLLPENAGTDIAWVDGNQFSPTDMSGEEGWLLAPNGKVLYHTQASAGK
jgi:hypothetical protein